MKNKSFHLFGFLIVLFISLCLVRPVFAHSDIPRLEINPERLNPGAVLEVRGVNFEFEVDITLTLIGSGIEIPLGTVAADADGVFTQNIILPVDLKAGGYTLRAAANDHEIFSPQFTVWGSAVVESGDQRADEDQLVAPMPTLPVTNSTSSLSNEKPASVSNSSRLLMIVAGLGILGILTFVVRKVITRS